MSAETYARFEEVGMTLNLLRPLREGRLIVAGVKGLHRIRRDCFI